MTIEDDIAFLGRVPLLGSLGTEALRILAIGAESRTVRRGGILFSVGEPADCGYIVQEGLFRLKTPGVGNKTDKESETTAGPGMLLDDMALLIETPRSATATATEPSTVVRISRSLFLKMLEGYPNAARHLRDTLAVRSDRMSREMIGVRDMLQSLHTRR
jgi:CRP-like cAMP-binding protein